MGFLGSTKHALRGVGYVIGHERNARIHLAVAVLALSLGFALKVSDFELASIFFAILIVFLAEITNTAFEKVLDIIQPRHDPRVRLVKDMAAGGVLVAATGAAVIGVTIFTPYILELLWRVR